MADPRLKLPAASGILVCAAGMRLMGHLGLGVPWHKIEPDYVEQCLPTRSSDFDVLRHNWLGSAGIATYPD